MDNMISRPRSKNQMVVVLGAQTMKAFVSSPKNFDVLGIVQIGFEYGLLGTTSSGKYFRINGSTIQELKTAAIEDAINIAHRNGRGESYSGTRKFQSPVPTSSPVILHKRRRQFQRPDCVGESAEFRPLRNMAA